jgi:hypothetical protein
MSTVTSRVSRSSKAVIVEANIEALPSQGEQAPDGESQEKVDPKFTLLESETLMLLRKEAIEAAEEHLQLPNSPTERALDRRRVKELVGRIKGGVWLPCSWATVIYDGAKYRMNGRHSSEAILEAGSYLPERVGIHLDHYRAEDRESMAMLFRQFDARFSARTKQDISGAYQGLVRELETLSRSKSKAAIEGIGWYQRAVLREPMPSNEAIYELFFFPTYYPFLKWFDRIITSKTRELLPRGVVGAMRATYLTSESGAQEFWPHVAKQDITDDNDPRSFLGQELQGVLENKGKNKEGVSLAAADYYCKCVKAWNAFRFGERVSSLKVNAKKGWPDIAD